MKYYLALLSFLLQIAACAQPKINTDSNFIYFEEVLNEYKIDTCLEGLLKAVVEADSIKSHFPPDKFYYDLTFENRTNYRFMSITPSRWEKSGTLDFKGVIKIGNMSFLCRGDFESDSQFVQLKSNIKVKLMKPKAYQFDSIDVRIETFSWKPSIAGKYNFCSGTPIDLFVIVGDKIDRYGL